VDWHYRCPACTLRREARKSISLWSNDKYSFHGSGELFAARFSGRLIYYWDFGGARVGRKTFKVKIRWKFEREIAALRSTLAQVWAALVDIDDPSLREEAIDAVDDACEIMAADCPEDNLVFWKLR
jgi:hypothetical protein